MFNVLLNTVTIVTVFDVLAGQLAVSYPEHPQLKLFIGKQKRVLGINQNSEQIDLLNN